MSKQVSLLNKAIFILINTAAFALISTVFSLSAHNGIGVFGLISTLSAWLIYSIIYSAVGYAVIKDRFMPSNIKILVFTILFIVITAILFFIAAASDDLYADYFSAVLIMAEIIFLVAAVIDWCISVGVSLLAMHIIDRKSNESDITHSEE